MDETVLPRVVEAFGALHGYHDALEREPGLTPAVFAKRVVAEWVMSQVDLYEARKASANDAGRVARRSCGPRWSSREPDDHG